MSVQVDIVVFLLKDSCSTDLLLACLLATKLRDDVRHLHCQRSNSSSSSEQREQQVDTSKLMLTDHTCRQLVARAMGWLHSVEHDFMEQLRVQQWNTLDLFIETNSDIRIRPLESWGC